VPKDERPAHIGRLHPNTRTFVDESLKEPMSKSMRELIEKLRKAEPLKRQRKERSEK
jgi:hypothetical protein